MAGPLDTESKPNSTSHPIRNDLLTPLSACAPSSTLFRSTGIRDRRHSAPTRHEHQHELAHIVHPVHTLHPTFHPPSLASPLLPPLLPRPTVDLSPDVPVRVYETRDALLERPRGCLHRHHVRHRLHHPSRVHHALYSQPARSVPH